METWDKEAPKVPESEAKRRWDVTAGHFMETGGEKELSI